MRIMCIVKYDGSEFSGFQIQEKKRTVQGAIQKAIEKICKEPIKIHASGRTDAKVHANGQVFHFDTSQIIPEKNWKVALNHFLPDDIYIVESFYVDDNFHSRYSPKSKTYTYLLNTGEYSPKDRKYIYQYNRTLDINLMIEASKIFLGEHDFASFCTYDGLGTTIRDIYSFDINQKDNIITFKITGNGFRRYMVRHIVGGLIQVGAKRLDKERLKSILESNGAIKCLHKAKPQGLYLEEVLYED